MPYADSNDEHLIGETYVAEQCSYDLILKLLPKGNQRANILG